MRYLLIVLGMIGMVSPLAAMQSQSQRNELCQIMQPCLPPAQYASGPFLAKPVIRNVTMREIQSICGGGARAFLGDRGAQAFGGGNAIFGCANLQPTSCVVHVPADVKTISADLYDVILQHELGHCRGWRHQRYRTGSAGSA